MELRASLGCRRFVTDPSGISGMALNKKKAAL